MQSGGLLYRKSVVEKTYRKGEVLVWSGKKGVMDSGVDEKGDLV